jgi:hypothetical protein
MRATFVLDGPGGELDRHTIDRAEDLDGDELTAALISWLRSEAISLAPGDTLRIEEAE